jgi:serine/threonine-protein phosphatase 2A regulatory subunit A
MASDEVFVKVNAIHRLKIVATILGPDATRSQLIPYITSTLYLDSLLNEEDEVLFALAEELGSLSRYITGSSSILITPLEYLAAIEETVVRDQAVKSLASVAELLPDSDIISIFAPMVLRLSNSEQFYSRVSACGLFSHAYPRSGSIKERLRQRFLELSHEDSPMVRRAAATFIGKFAQVVEKEVLINDLMPSFRQLSQDDMDQVRVLCLDSLIVIAKLFTKEENRLHTLPVILAVGEDKSWKVRHHFVKNFPKLSEVMGKDITENSLIQTYVQLLRDQEAEVRAEALNSLLEISSSISREKILTIVFPAVCSVASDTSANTHVIKNATDAVLQMSKVLGREVTVSKVVPLLEDLLKTENPEVRLHVLSGLGGVGEYAGVDLLTPGILNILQKLVNDSPNWRIREAIMKCAVELAKYLGQDVFVRDLQELFLKFLTDSVSQVRESGVETLNSLLLYVREDWVVNTLLQRISEVYHQDLGYLHRITALRALSACKLPLDKLQPLFSEAARDSVPNVRFCLCKILKEKQGLDLSALKP